MPTPYFQLLGHAFLTVHTCEHDEEIKAALSEKGFGADQLSSGSTLVEQGLELPDRRIEEVGDERITGHEVHSSATEVEMWRQETKFRLKKAVDDRVVVAKTLGGEIHCDEHAVEVVAKALRMIGMIRTHPVLHEQFGTGRSVKDQLIRGNTLLSKLFDVGDKLMSPGHAGDPDAAVFDDIEACRKELTKWLQGLDRTADALADSPEILGEIGYVPDDVGLPVGGTGYSITLHERSHREPPDPDAEKKGDPGWTIGRQGRNDENMGKGWVEPSFD